MEINLPSSWEFELFLDIDVNNIPSGINDPDIVDIGDTSSESVRVASYGLVNKTCPFGVIVNPPLQKPSVGGVGGSVIKLATQ